MNFWDISGTKARVLTLVENFWGVFFLVMGLGNDEEVLVDDGDGGGRKSGGGGGSIACSICLEAVSDNGDRSWAKLQCGHQFHLGKRALVSDLGMEFWFCSD